MNTYCCIQYLLLYTHRSLCTSRCRSSHCCLGSSWKNDNSDTLLTILYLLFPLWRDVRNSRSVYRDGRFNFSKYCTKSHPSANQHYRYLQKKTKNNLWQTKFPMADFITNDDSVIPEQQEGWRRSRPCSMSQLLTTQRASTHLFFHHSHTEPLSEPANVFPRDLDVYFCLILHCTPNRSQPC